jgi:hypothetical protein
MSQNARSLAKATLPVNVVGAAVFASLVGSNLAQGAPMPADEVATILDHVRAAVGFDQLEKLPAGLTLEADANIHEAEGHLELRFDSRGRFISKVSGPLAQSFGFDGTTAWIVDWGKIPRTLELLDREWTLLSTWIRTGQWLARAPLVDVALVPAASNNEVVALSVNPKGGRLRAQLLVDRTSWLPRNLVRTGAQGEIRCDLADYRDYSGLKLPARYTESKGGIRTRLVNITAARPAADSAVDPYRPVTARPSGSRFDRDVTRRLEVKRTTTGHVLIHPEIDGADLGWFILDTGGGSPTIVASNLAATKSWPVLGSSPLTSIFGTVRSPIRSASSLRIGPLTIADPILLEMDLEPLSKVFGVPLGGIVGYDLFSRCAVAMELANDRIELYETADDSLGAGRWQELIIHQCHPVIPARFEGDRRGLFTIDIGAAGGPGGNVAFTAPTVEELHLLDGREFGRAKAATHELGIAEIGWFELGGHRFEKPTALFALDRKGPFNDEYVSGVVGVNFLKEFRVVLDYAHKRAALIPRGKSAE